MKRLYIRGLVKTANRVRRDLSRPLPADHREKLRRFVTESLQQVDAILSSHGAKLECLPAPTRRAYQFLANLDLDSVTLQPAATLDAHTPGTVSLVGLKSFWDRILNELAQSVPAGGKKILHDSVASASKNIERYLSDNGLTSTDLTTQSRAARGWLAFFTERENFDAYLSAIARAKPIMEILMARAGGFEAPALVHFRSLPGLFRYQGYRNGTRITLSTPMICFSDKLFRALAEAAFNGGSKQPIMRATSDEEYQSIQAELEALSGMEAHTAGVHHDLLVSFDRVNRRYFGGNLTHPRLTWSRTFAGRKFGHYDPIRDVVMISSTLDQADTPPFVVDFVMFHELLHKKLGVSWQNGRRAVHTPEFRMVEKRFEEYAAAEAVLTTLAQHA